eukprot:838111-Pelagomonas_calceolata.AAC.1
MLALGKNRIHVSGQLPTCGSEHAASTSTTQKLRPHGLGNGSTISLHGHVAVSASLEHHPHFHHQFNEYYVNNY